MEFDERLGILLEGKIISPEVDALVRGLIARLEEQWGISLTEQNGGRMITHLAMALARISRNEAIASPEQDLLDEFRGDACFPRALEIAEDLAAGIPVNLPRSEADYLVMNICLLLDE
jgi:transcriptional regulatory protein LevR